MTRIEKAAIELHELLWNYTGASDEWPITLKADDTMHDRLVDVLNELGEAVEEVKPNSKPWPVRPPI